MGKATDNMKKPKRKKPKFRVGQVVCFKPYRDFYKIKEVWSFGNECNYRFHRRGWIALTSESELRPLTEKEIGPKRKRG